jgi:hypothetical protein
MTRGSGLESRVHEEGHDQSESLNNYDGSREQPQSCGSCQELPMCPRQIAETESFGRLLCRACACVWSMSGVSDVSDVEWGYYTMLSRQVRDL